MLQQDKAILRLHIMFVTRSAEMFGTFQALANTHSEASK